MNKEKISIEQRQTNSSKARHFGILFTALFVFWILLSGKMEAKFILIGFLTAVVSTWVTGPLLRLPSTDGKGYYYAFDFPYWKYVKYWGWLLVEIVKSNIDLAKIILSPQMPINPKVIQFRKPMKNPIAHVTLGNSITLTPGTVTMDVIGEDTYMIHALTDEAALALVPEEGEGEMPKMVSYVFNEEAGIKRGEVQG